MILRDSEIIPSIMFHSVGLEKAPWIWSYISESVESFESKLQVLKNKNFNTIDWAELYDCMDGKECLPKDSIFLTFDDGYLDNWVYVFPLLKKYGMKATIFVNSDFVDPRDIVRPSLENVWRGEMQEADLQVAGFLSWPEMRLMEASGLVDIQSHAKTHTWYFTGPKVVDYHRKTHIERYPWLLWNVREDRKPFYLNEFQSHLVPYGAPIFENNKSLIATRFIPEPQAEEKIREYIVNYSVDKFYKQPDWQNQLQEKIDEWFPTGLPGSYETTGERENRIYHELAESKRKIEHNLNKTVNFICWPGGGNDEKVWEIAKKVGYISWTLGSQDQSNFRNRFNTMPGYIKRIGSSNQVLIGKNLVGEGGSLFMWLNIATHQGSTLYKYALLAYKVICLLIKRMKL